MSQKHFLLISHLVSHADNGKQTNKRTVRRILMSSKLPLFHYKILEILSLRSLTNPDEHKHTMTHKFSSGLHDLYQLYYEMPVQTRPWHFRSSWNGFWVASRFIFYLLPLNNRADSILLVFFTDRHFFQKYQFVKQRYKPHSSDFFIPQQLHSFFGVYLKAWNWNNAYLMGKRKLYDEIHTQNISGYPSI